MNTIVKKLSLVALALAIMLPAMAQFGEDEQPHAVFQSTSAMQLSGSAYSNVQTLNGDGMIYMAEQTAALSAPMNNNGPNRIRPVVSPTDAPIGDAVLPLLLMALAFGAGIAVRKKRAKTTH